ncbi:hypothetical protein KDC22_13240 [Paenibacillus tritici]|uniref:hypothetical protein n=1 Tax=Paenibacillus tritici TaxID=1873425 RepID=UPI001BA7EAE7|nr:hypothetical protein [Paenibacillus tritici]QUL57342.1 hypothetical protein KDC22_13240 [Paenibacillus tritici]
MEITNFAEKAQYALITENPFGLSLSVGKEYIIYHNENDPYGQCEYVIDDAGVPLYAFDLVCNCIMYQ